MGNIAEYLRTLRTAVFGKDVRESIAQSIEQTYEDATRSGNANMEVSDARGYYSSLKNRLDGDKNNLQTQINGLASGSPLVASSVSEMTDTSRVYVNTTDGHWYYYNGTAWADGGPYQAAEDSTSVNKINQDLNHIFEKNVITGINKNNPEFLTGVYTSAQDYNGSSSYCRSKYIIPVSTGDIIRCVTDNEINYKGLALYRDETLIGVTNNTGSYVPKRSYISIDGNGYFFYTFTIPNGVNGILYQRAVSINNISDMLTINEEMPTTYKAYYSKLLYNMKDEFVGKGKNISDLNDCVKSAINVLKNKKIGFLGDSYTDVSYYYGAKIRVQAGIVDVANGKQGSRIFSDNSWVSDGQTITALSFWHRINLFEENSFDAICIFGGINDASSRNIYETNIGNINDVALSTSQIQNGEIPTTFYQAYKTVIEMLWEKYPCVPLLLIIPPHQLNASYNPSQRTYMGIEPIVEAERNIAEFYGIPICDLYQSCQELNNYKANVSAYRIGMSNIHPNDAGQQAIARCVTDSLVKLFQ